MIETDDLIQLLPQQAPLPAALLDLNNAHARELSWLEPARFQQLADKAFRAWRRASPMKYSSLTSSIAVNL